jgi:hypothetical protein
VAKLLIINADDFGLTPGVNAGMLDAHLQGLLTSVSLFAHAPATAGAIALAQRTPSLGVGGSRASAGRRSRTSRCARGRAAMAHGLQHRACSPATSSGGFIQDASPRRRCSGLPRAFPTARAS